MAIQVSDGRRERLMAIAAKNREAIRDFFERHPGSTITECAKETGISLPTVSRHVRAMTGKDQNKQEAR